jgi:hypothetical protein
MAVPDPATSVVDIDTFEPSFSANTIRHGLGRRRRSRPWTVAGSLHSSLTAFSLQESLDPAEEKCHRFAVRAYSSQAPLNALVSSRQMQSTATRRSLTSLGTSPRM